MSGSDSSAGCVGTVYLLGMFVAFVIAFAISDEPLIFKLISSGIKSLFSWLYVFIEIARKVFR